MLSSVACAIRLLQETTCISSRPGGIRTPITRIWSPVLYRSSYWPTFFKIRKSPQLVRPAYLVSLLPCLSMELTLTTEAAVFLEFESLRRAALILRRRVVAAPAFDARQSHQVPHGFSLRYLQVHPHS